MVKGKSRFNILGVHMKNRIKINDLDLEYQVIHRAVKYARLEIKNGDLRLILPSNYSNHEEVVEKHRKWIYRKISRIKKLQKDAKEKEIELSRSDDELRQLVRFYMTNISNDLKVTVNRVSFRRMKSRWGSCSSSGNININTRLKFLPSHLIEYVVHHELTHIMERKHDKRFWSRVSSKYPNYKKMEEELSIYWFLVKDLS
jgi:predicted metal-dependent hydrolase